MAIRFAGGLSHHVGKLDPGIPNPPPAAAGLETLSEEKIDDVLGDVRRALLEADVALPVVRKFLAQVKEKAVGEIVQTRVSFKDQKMKVSPADVFVKICEDELIGLARAGGHLPALPHQRPGGGHAGGPAGFRQNHLRGQTGPPVQHQGRNPMLVAADVYRPAAVEQLRVLGEQLGVGVFIRDGLGPVLICKEAVQEAVKTGRDTVILDTAGPSGHRRKPNARELEDIKRETRPDNILLVCDAMIGQDAVRMSDAFNQRLNVDGFIMTKLDGDTRGGAILSVKEVTGKPIKFVGVGEPGPAGGISGWKGSPRAFWASATSSVWCATSRTLWTRSRPRRTPFDPAG